MKKEHTKIDYVVKIPFNTPFHCELSPALYFSAMMGLESFLPVLWEEDGLSCSLS